MGLKKDRINVFSVNKGLLCRYEKIFFIIGFKTQFELTGNEKVLF